MLYTFSTVKQQICMMQAVENHNRSQMSETVGKKPCNYKMTYVNSKVVWKKFPEGAQDPRETEQLKSQLCFKISQFFPRHSLWD